MTFEKAGDSYNYSRGGVKSTAEAVVAVSIDPVTGDPQTALPPGRAPAANGVPVTLSAEDLAAILPAKGMTDRSLGASTTAQPAMPANGNRRGWKIRNDSTVDVWINFKTTATMAAGGGNMKILAGGYLASEPGFVETGVMSIIASAAANVTIYEFQ
ncbi:hypothetical protein [Agrobacterium cavarae]|uniref:hypothetical protein n=1 Tax=Agrobacterium cavarae TaxID=2528239 RepID=UPI00289ADCB0|nr:hypothetical protein [Agrobacterium cavarae]